MLRSLVGSEMCIRDRVSTQSTGFGATAMASFSCRGLLCLITITLALGYQHARILWCDAGVTLNSNKFGATASATASGAQELETYSDWYESYMRWTLRGLEGQGQVTKATVRLYTTRSDGPMHIYMQWLNSTAWGDDTGVRGPGLWVTGGQVFPCNGTTVRGSVPSSHPSRRTPGCPT
eukprot:TRINITY_DN738_c0_g1_i12.p1 TRINITY_DN738_c0_g1~~TRINITY_DN738_c0_g1_i12.p1  ORF type:complete len:200 (+),score=43.26 TRINITY_DN738_c0_g1_i12:67-600(+)